MAQDIVFRVIREIIDQQTVRILLEPYSAGQHIHVHEGDEFVTGTLNTNPWDDLTNKETK